MAVSFAAALRGRWRVPTATAVITVIDDVFGPAPPPCAGVGPLPRAQGLAALLPDGRAQRHSVRGALHEDVPADQGGHRCAGRGAAPPTRRRHPLLQPLHQLRALLLLLPRLAARLQTAWASNWCSRVPSTRPTAPAPPHSVAPAWRRACGEPLSWRAGGLWLFVLCSWKGGPDRCSCTAFPALGVTRRNGR